MKIDKIALFGYLILCIIAIFANFYGLYGLKLVSKSMLIPVLFFYYMGNVRRLNVLACCFLLFNFIGDSIGIFELEDEIKYLIIPFFLSNLTLILIMVKKIKKFKFSFFNFLSLFIIICFLGYLWYEIVNIFAFSEGNLQLKIGVYGFSLLLMSILVAYKIINQINSSNIFLLFCVTCLLISDVFYVLYNFQINLSIFDSIHFACQIFSYLLFVKYMINRDREVIV